MKLAKKIRAIVALAVLALISVVGVACGQTTSSQAFEFIKELPTEVVYGTELYFRDYLPREFGNEYELYASYYNVDDQKEVVDEFNTSLAYSFNYVSDYNFKIVRNGKDTLECTIKSMPEAPSIIEGGLLEQNARPNNVQNFDRILIMVFGGEPLNNNERATADPDYQIKATGASFQSVEIEGSDVENIDVSSGKITIDKIGYYTITYTATNRAGSDSETVTIRTVNEENHIDLVTGYLKENGEGKADNQLVFDMDGMPAPADGATVRARFGAGKGAQSDIYNAVYDAYTGKYTIDNFAHELAKEDNARIFLEGADGDLYSTLVTLPTIITQETIDKAGSAAILYNATEGYILLGSDIDLKKYPFTPSTVFTGVLDGNGYSISNLKGPQTVDSYGAKRDTGTSLFYNLVDATVKNVTINGVYATTGMLTQRVEGSCIFKNIIARMTGYAGARTSLIGYHAEDMDTSYVKNVIIEMPIYDPAKTGYVGMLTTHAGGKTVIENLFLVGGVGRIHSTIGNNTTFTPKHYTERVDSVDGFAEQDKDYFIGSNAEVVYKGSNNGTVSDFMLDMAGRVNMVVGLDASNIDLLQNVTSGYFYLKEDIDMAGVEYMPTQAKGTEFTGTLDGAGHKIMNFTAPSGYLGLFGWTGKGAIIKNIDIHVVTNTLKGAIIGQIRGATTIENANITVDKLDANLGGVVTSVVQGNLLVKDTNIVIKGAAGVKLGAGFIAAGEANSYNVTVENVKVVDLSNSFTNPYKGYSNTVANGKVKEDNVTLGADGELAVLGEDYWYIGGDILDANVDAIENEDFKAFVKDIVKDIEESVVFLDKENIDELLTATTGYYVLTEDVDMTGVTWNPVNGTMFTGTLNGKGYAIKNLTLSAHGDSEGLFSDLSTGAIIKNITITGTVTGNNKSLISGAIRGSVTFENCIFDLSRFSSYASGIFTRSLATSDPIYINDVAIIVNDSAMSASNNLLFGNYTALKNEKVTVDGLHIFDLATASNKITTLYNSSVAMVGADGETAVLGEDYHMYVGEFPYIELAKIQDAEIKAYMTDKFNKEITVLTQDNFTQLQSATAGYYLLGEDIDMTGVAWKATTVFSGTIDGRGHKVSNLDMTKNSGTGFILEVGATSTIKNITISGKVGSNNNGFLAFTYRGDGITLSNIVLEVEKMDSYNGGIVGKNLTEKCSNFAIKDLVVIVKDSAKNQYNGLLFGNYGAKSTATVDGLHIFDFAMSANKITSLYDSAYVTLNGTDGELAVLGEDYHMYSGDIMDLDLAKISDADVKAIVKSVYDEATKDVIYLNKDNITQLQSATSGYYMLEEDIDLKDVSWACTAVARNLTLNGKGHKIENIKLTGSNYQAFFHNFGGVIKNVSFNFASMSDNYKGLIGQIRAETVIENVVLDYDNFSGTYSGAIGAMNDKVSPVTLNNVLINFDNVTKGTNAGILMGVYAEAGRKVTMNGVIIHNKNADLNQLVAITDQKYAATIVGTEGTDYFMVTDILDADSSKLSGLAKSTLDAMQAEILKSSSVTILTEANIAQLQTATTGYYVLGEDIDMSKVDCNGAEDGLGKWAPADSTIFKGTLNGMGHTIENFTPCGSNYIGLFARGDGATIKNITIHFTKSPARAGVFGRVQGNGQTTVSNTNIVMDVLDTVYGTTITNAFSGKLTVKDTLVYIKDSSSSDPNNSGALGSKEAGTSRMVVDNVVVVDTKGKLTKLIPDANGSYNLIPVGTSGADAVNGTDYFFYSSVDAVKAAQAAGTLPVGFVTRLQDTGVLTANNG